MNAAITLDDFREYILALPLSTFVVISEIASAILNDQTHLIPTARRLSRGTIHELPGFFHAYAGLSDDAEHVPDAVYELLKADIAEWLEEHHDSSSDDTPA